MLINRCHAEPNHPHAEGAAKHAPKKTSGRRRIKNATTWYVLNNLPDPEIREAVARCIPRVKEGVEFALARLVKNLKHIDPTADAGAYRAVVGEWYRVVAVLRPDLTLADVEGWFVELWAEAGAERPDQFMVDHCRWHVDRSKPLSVRLPATLVALAKLFGRRRFFLGVRTLGRCLGVSTATAARHLKAMAERGSIRIEKRAGPHIYTRDADVIHTGPLFALGDRAKQTASLPDEVPAPHPMTDLTEPPAELLVDVSPLIGGDGPWWEGGGWETNDGDRFDRDWDEPPPMRTDAPPVDF